MPLVQSKMRPSRPSLASASFQPDNRPRTHPSSRSALEKTQKSANRLKRLGGFDIKTSIIKRGQPTNKLVLALYCSYTQFATQSSSSTNHSALLQILHRHGTAASAIFKEHTKKRVGCMSEFLLFFCGVPHAISSFKVTAPFTPKP